MELGALLDEPREAPPRVRVGQPRIHHRQELLHPRPEELVDQRLPVREAPVDGPDPDAGTLGDLVEADLKTALGEHVGRGIEDPQAVALRVGTQWDARASRRLPCVTSVQITGGYLLRLRATVSEVEKFPPLRKARDERSKHRSPPRPPLADPGRDRPRPADGGPRRHDREHRAAVGPDGPRVLRRLASMGDHGVRAGLRLVAAPRRTDQRPHRSQMDVHRGSHRIRRRLRDRRRRAFVRGSDRRPRAAGRIRRAPRAGRALDRHDDLHGPGRASEGVRRSTGRSPAPAPPSACSSAAFSPSSSRGARPCT